MAAKQTAVVPATPEAADVVMSASEVFAVITKASDMVSQHDDAIAALTEAKDDAAWSVAWSTAAGAFVGETDRIDAAVKRAQDIVTAGRRASDAHSAFRVRLVGAYVARKGAKVSDADVARAVYGEDSNARRKQIGRDRLALKVLVAATKAKATHPEYAVPSITEALTAVNAGTVADAKAVVARASEARELTETEAKPTKAPAVIRRTEALLDALALLDTESLTEETAATLRTLLAKVGAAADGIVAPAKVTNATDAATSTK